MARPRTWSGIDLPQAVKHSKSIRQVLSRLGLVEAGGNYQHIKRIIAEERIDTSHFTGKGWKKGLTVPREPVIPLESILVEKSHFGSHKLKKRLFRVGLKAPQCELCGWAEQSEDGRVPVELDHINGNRYDNRIENLRILCPNCHSLQATHRGKNIRRPGGGMADARRLKRREVLKPS